MTTIYVVCRRPVGEQKRKLQDAAWLRMFFDRARAEHECQFVRDYSDCEVREYIVLEPEEARTLREGA